MIRPGEGALSHQGQVAGCSRASACRPSKSEDGPPRSKLCVLSRWAENDRARLSALEAMNAMLERRLEEISEMTATPTSQLKFLSDAWAQVCAH